MIALGPGLGRSEWAQSLFARVLADSRPRVLDADALTVMGPGFSERVKARSADTIATPHAGEFRALTAAGLALPATEVQRVVRSDKSGTTEGFSRYLAAVSPSFLAICSRSTIFWILPVMVMGRASTNSK